MDDHRILIECGVDVPMRDGTRLQADVYRPESGRWPTLVMRTPYGRSPYPDNFVLLPPVPTARRGYAVVVQDVRGRGTSGGQFRAFDEVDDGFDTVDWAAQQSWSTGVVGCFGSSYMGAAALQAGASEHPAVRAIACLQASSDYYEGRTYRGGALELGSVVSVGLAALGRTALARVQEADERRRLRRAYVRALRDLADQPVAFPMMSRLQGEDDELLGSVAPWLLEWISHDKRDEYWERISLEDRYGAVSASALHVTGWFDAMKEGALANFRALAHSSASDHARKHQRLVVGPWPHYSLRGYEATRVGDLAFGMDAALDIDELQLRWFDEHLRDSDHSEPAAPPRVRLFVMGRNAWRDEEMWPLDRASDVRLYLSSTGHASDAPDDGMLCAAPSKNEGRDHFDYDPRYPVPTIGGAHLLLPTLAPVGPRDQRAVEERDDVAVYTTQALDDDIEVTGYVRAELWVATSAVSTDFTARLVDVQPDGTPVSVCDGILRLPAADGGAMRQIVLSLGATSQVFLAGHRLRLDISSSNFPRFDPNPNTGDSSLHARACVVAHQTIVHGGATPSSLVLPVVPAPA